MSTTKSLPPPELNEIYAFQANCLYSAGKYDETLKFLATNEKYF
jgi:hypothetical protein